jgi:hypothetical protein
VSKRELPWVKRRGRGRGKAWKMDKAEEARGRER